MYINTCIHTHTHIHRCHTPHQAASSYSSSSRTYTHTYIHTHTQVSYPSPGRLEVLVELSTLFNNGLFLMIERTNPADPVRNIRVLPPGYSDGVGYKGSPFHPSLLHILRRYKVLRCVAVHLCVYIYVFMYNIYIYIYIYVYILTHL